MFLMMLFLGFIFEEREHTWLSWTEKPLAKAGKLEEVGRQQKPQTELEAELQRTKRELAEVKMERDLLKKFAAYFAKQSR